MIETKYNFNKSGKNNILCSKVDKITLLLNSHAIEIYQGTEQKNFKFKKENKGQKYER